MCVVTVRHSRARPPRWTASSTLSPKRFETLTTGRQTCCRWIHPELARPEHPQLGLSLSNG